MDVKKQRELCGLHEQLALHEIKQDSNGSNVGFCTSCKTLLYRDMNGVWKNALNSRKELDTISYSIERVYKGLSEEDKADVRARVVGIPHAAKIFVTRADGDDSMFEAMSNSTGAVTDFLKHGYKAENTKQIALLEAAAVRSPRTAFYYAYSSKSTLEPSKIDKYRLIASKSACYALKFALHVDNRKPHAHTRAGVLSDCKQSFKYSIWIDTEPNDELRTACCKEPYYAYYYAKSIDKSPRNDTRTAACKEPKYATVYARWVDGRALPETKAASLPSSFWSFEYLRLLVHRFDSELDQAIMAGAVSFPDVVSKYNDWKRFKGIK